LTNGDTDNAWNVIGKNCECAVESACNILHIRLRRLAEKGDGDPSDSCIGVYVRHCLRYQFLDAFYKHVVSMAEYGWQGYLLFFIGDKHDAKRTTDVADS